ncbi:hypothetical protein B9Z55_014228 [Caenorhabditis nigoni]|uniref:Uncharacterized protein n=1 Tax=Caenorhabditis nigoni TaxID=1611254 RepID=A0A2G5U516_9PELO|nr:hypothetical protein B9Z55_014228 [Caenorhabditis nigoni]
MVTILSVDQFLISVTGNGIYKLNIDCYRVILLECLQYQLCTFSSAFSFHFFSEKTASFSKWHLFFCCLILYLNLYWPKYTPKDACSVRNIASNSLNSLPSWFFENICGERLRLPPIRRRS